MFGKGNNCYGCSRGRNKAYLTAYETALRYGFQGSEEEWIRSIGTIRVANITGIAGGTFECDMSLGQIRKNLEDGYIPVLVYEGIPAFLTDPADDYLGFSTPVVRDADGDYYDFYAISGRENTVERMSASGTGGGGGGIGPGTVTYAMLNATLKGSVDKAEHAVLTTPMELTVSDQQQARENIGAYHKGSSGIPIDDLTSPVQASLARADTAVQIAKQDTKTASHTVRVAAAADGTLYVPTYPSGGGETPEAAAVTVLVTVTNSGSEDTASKTPAEIYAILDEGATQIVLIDAGGRQCEMIKPPYSTGNGGYTDVVFWTLNERDMLLTIYTVNSYGLVTSDTFPLTGFYTKPSGGIPATDLASAVQTALTAAGTAVQPSELGDYVPKGQQATKTSAETQAVTVDSNGKLWVKPPGEGSGSATWSDVLPSGGIRQTDIANLTVTFTESSGQYSASSNLTAVLAALADNKAVDCKMGDYYGELIYAHADENEPGNEFAIFKVVEQVVTYQGQDGEERLPQVRMFYMTHVGVTYQVNAIGGACYVYVTETDGVYDVDTVNTAKTAQSIQGLLTAFYAGIETRMIVVDGYYRWSHPVSFHYGSAEIRFAGPEAVTVNGRTEIRMVEYTINSSSHVGRTVGATLPVPAGGEPLNPSADKGKTPEVDEYGRYVLVDGGMKISAPGSGYSGKVLKASGADSASWETIREVPDGASGDNGKYLKNVNGTPTWSTAPSGSGVNVPDPADGTQAEPSTDTDKMLVVNALGEYELSGGQTYLLDPDTTGTYAGFVKVEKTFAQLLAEIQSRTPPRFYCSVDGLAVELRPVAVNTTGGTIFLANVWESNQAWVMLSYIGGAMRGTPAVIDIRDPGNGYVTVSNNTEYTAQMAKNKIYRIPDGNTKVTITSVPATGTSVIIFTTPSTIPDGYFTKPSAMKMPADWEGVEASTRYEINVMDGYALVDARAVS